MAAVSTPSSAGGMSAAGARAGSARRDGRSNTQIRPLACDLSQLHRADGSARLVAGGTSVLAGVYGPTAPRRRRRANGERAVLEVCVQPSSGLPGPAEKELERVAAAALAPLVLLSAHPRTAITVVLQVLGSDGGATAVALNAACLALVDAGVAMTGMLAAASCGVAADGRVVMDPIAEEEATLRAVATFAFGSRAPTKPITAVVTGLLDDAALEQLRAAAEAACASVQAFHGVAVKRKVYHDAGVARLPSVDDATAALMAEAAEAAAGDAAGGRQGGGGGDDGDGDSSDDDSSSSSSDDGAAGGGAGGDADMGDDA